MNQELPPLYQALVILVNVLIIIIQGVALWRSVKLNQRNWFIAILILGPLTIGIIPVFYLFKFADKKLTIKEIQSWNYDP